MVLAGFNLILGAFCEFRLSTSISLKSPSFEQDLSRCCIDRLKPPRLSGAGSEVESYTDPHAQDPDCSKDCTNTRKSCSCKRQDK